MSNILDNGTVLPFGILSGDSSSMGDAFKKTYQNYSLRVGVVMQAYSKNNSRNLSKKVPEYDVMTWEQNEDQGSTTITYKNCTVSSSLGSVADFFECNIRKMKSKKSKGVTPSPNDQNGSIVLLLCLNGLSDKAIIVGALSHPDRKSKLVDDSPHLEGEYNGVNIKVSKDGSTQLVFKGATDNDGKIIDSSQGPTTIKIEKDGSFEVNHKTITLRLDKQGDVTLTTDGSINVTAKKDAQVTVQGNVSITAVGNATVKCKEALIEASGTATVEGKTVKLGKGASEAVIKGDTFKSIFSAHTHIGNLGAPTGPPLQPMDAALSKKAKTE